MEKATQPSDQRDRAFVMTMRGSHGLRFILVLRAKARLAHIRRASIKRRMKTVSPLTRALARAERQWPTRAERHARARPSLPATRTCIDMIALSAGGAESSLVQRSLRFVRAAFDVSHPRREIGASSGGKTCPQTADRAPMRSHPSTQRRNPMHSSQLTSLTASSLYSGVSRARRCDSLIFSS
jgi:hypothetical protein